jgi:hypothetical protein
MARPGARASYSGTWLDVDAYKAYARIAPTDTTDDAAISEAVAAAMEALELRAPPAFAVTADGTDVFAEVPAGVHQAGLLLTNRLMARRNSPDGVVGVADMGTARVASYDADITALVAPWSEMVVG